VPDDRKGEQARSATKGSQETVASPNDKIILAATRRMSNIFLHFPEDVEKKEEIAFAPPAVVELRGY
jgi:hypothetical protein